MALRSPLSALAAAVLAGSAHWLAPAPAAAEPVRLTLAGVVERARAMSHLVKASEQEIARAGQDLKKARGQRILTEAKVNLAAGLVPEARGDILAPESTAGSYDNLGPFYRIELKLVQPVWTFGRLDALEGLATQGVRVEEARRDLVASSVGLEAVRAYRALDAAVRGEAVAGDMRKDFDKLLGQVEERLRDEKSGVDDADLFEVRARDYAIERLFRDAEELRAFAADAIRTVCVLPPGSEPASAEEPLPDGLPEPGRTEELVARGVAAHPEVRALEEAVRAAEAKVGLQRASRSPLVFLGAGFGHAHAGNRDEQDNPWAYENFNYTRVGAEMGLAWDAALWRQNADVGAAEAEWRALGERLGALRDRVAVDVRRSVRDVGRHRRLLEAARASLKAAKSRLRLTLDNWETGLGEVSDVLDAYEDYYKLRAEEPQREFDLNVALARLAWTLGDVDLYVRWVADGTVRL